MKKLDGGTDVSKNSLKTAITRSLMVATLAVSCQTVMAQDGSRPGADFSSQISGLNSEKAIPNA